ncbi:MAG: glycosyltransferase [Proteobacteria bacterium]|nr:glycosyltransferase [Pseudomonadota bacterium]
MDLLLTIAFSVVTIAAAIYVAFELRLLLGYLLMPKSHPPARPEQNNPVRASRPIPAVVVQLPLFNEGTIALAIVEAVCAFDYPAEHLQIQVLDDSTDDTPVLLAPLIARMQARGLDIRHMRRGNRQGWKAGALAWGLAESTAEFVAIFDADFVPSPDFLRRILIDSVVFDDPATAFLQARWTYTNSDQNLLTRAQSILIDRHFAIQKPYQLTKGRTLAFNGSAGLWRRSAIDAAGGWSADTLCEDLDLSYRCALVGLKGKYDFALSCPSEIPSSILAFKLQQRRWAKGSAQCFRKLGADVFRSRQIRHHWEDIYAMAGYVVHPIMLVYFLLWPWVVRGDLPWPLLLASQACMTIANITVISGFLMAAFALGQRAGANLFGSLAFALILGMALIVNTTLAFFAGLFEKAGVFERTPKHGRGKRTTRSESLQLRLHWSIYFEIAFLVYMLWLTILLFASHHAGAAISCAVFVGSMGFIVLSQLTDRFGPRIRLMTEQAAAFCRLATPRSSS